uniref:Transmembrane protein 235 n=1 Tax=Salmo trutta TaxID=8032 RepID=A0A673W7R3_SALTR
LARLSFGSLVITAGIFGILSFAFLAAAIGSDYWYIKVNRTNETDTEILDSHSGLWIIYKGVCIPMRLVLLTSFKVSINYSQLVLLTRLKVSPSYINYSQLVCVFIYGVCVSSGVLTLSGVSLYISYSQQALAEAESLVGAERLAQVVSTSFELGLAWLSFCLEVLTGLLLAAHPATLQSGSPGHEQTEGASQ